MGNVYEQVETFFMEIEDWELPVSREWVEGYFRQKAWQGEDEEQLVAQWRELEYFFSFLVYSGEVGLDELDTEDYQLALEWIAGTYKDFAMTLRSVQHFFAVVQDFFQYLTDKKLVASRLMLDQLETAAAQITSGRSPDFDMRQILEERDLMFETELERILRHPGADVPEELMEIVGEAVERLIDKLGEYFQQDEFHDDFQRALFLYTGPFEDVPEEENEFWLGFWDYFLFDYHLLENDATPLQHFYQQAGDTLSSGEGQILRDLLDGEFVVFYISRVVNGDWVECINLFTDEVFQLPYPDFDYKTLRRMLFFGHVFSRTTVMVNYVTSVEVSANLRKRIREEVTRLKDWFLVQEPQAGWKEFLSRHALSVRHAIHVLTTQATVNVIPFEIPVKGRADDKENLEREDEVSALLEGRMPDYGFSRHDIRLAKQLWNDYRAQRTDEDKETVEVLATALIYVYSLLNSPMGFSLAEIAKDSLVAVEKVQHMRVRLERVLGLRKYDARYLSEEGFIFFLFS